MNSLPCEKIVNLLEREEVFPVLEEHIYFLIIFEGTALLPLKKVLPTDFPIFLREQMLTTSYPSLPLSITSSYTESYW